MCNLGKTILIAMLAITAFADAVWATTRYVSPAGLNVSPYTNWLNAATSIQDALDVAMDGDSVIVTSGYYYVTNELAISKAISLISSSSPRYESIISAVGETRIILIQVDGVTIDGFTLLNGNPTQWGGAINAADGDAIIRNCLIQSNKVVYEWQNGGGLYAGRNVLIENCIFLHNQAFEAGGAIMCLNASYIIRNCVMAENTAGVEGGGVALIYGGGVIENCTIFNNSAYRGGGTYSYYGGGEDPRTYIYNSILYSNNAPNDPNYSNCVMSYSCTMPSSGPACITNYPDFVSISNQCYRLNITSPCINTGTNQCWMKAGYDLDYKPRIIGNTADMGAYELGTDLRVLVKNNEQPYLEWNSESNFNYQIQELSHLETGTWSNTGDELAGSGIPLQANIGHFDGSAMSFRVFKTPAP